VDAGDPPEPYRHVGDPEWLSRHDLFVAEGRRVVERLLASAGYELHSIVVTRAAFEALAPRLAAAACGVHVCTAAQLEAVTGFDFHRGCLALARRPKPRAPGEFLSARRLIALEGVGNPDNVGGVFRTAAALGADGVLLDGRSGDPLYRKAIRTSMAATLQLPWTRVDRWPNGLEEFHRAGMRLVALTPDPQAAALDEFSATVTQADKLLLLLGSEGSGLAAATLERADVRVRIPISPAVDSLNVVVATGIALDRLR
jgi:tRNA G18 (ribose-2'-O)-methylase SpoU